MKTFIPILFIAAIGATGLTWAEQANTNRYDSGSRPVLSQPAPQRSKVTAMKAVGQAQVPKATPGDPPPLPISRTESNDAWDPRCVEAIC